jgi:hypothetical protein
MTHPSHPNTFCSTSSDYFLHCCLPTHCFKWAVLSRICLKCSTLFCVFSFCRVITKKKEFTLTKTSRIGVLIDSNSNGNKSNDKSNAYTTG